MASIWLRKNQNSIRNNNKTILQIRKDGYTYMGLQLIILLVEPTNLIS